MSSGPRGKKVWGVRTCFGLGEIERLGADGNQGTGRSTVIVFTVCGARLGFRGEGERSA